MGLGLGLGLGMGMGSGSGNSMSNGANGGPNRGKGGRGNQQFFADTGSLPMLDKGEDIKAGANPMQVKGGRRDVGEETYIEIKGPASLGNRSKTPYYDVLPKYRKQAEQALDKKKIPKEHQKRVKDYFDSLQRGGG